MKSWLVDVAVAVFIWTRPECQKAQFDVIRRARPRRLYLFSDGGRNNHEWNMIRNNRDIYDNQVDWDCEIVKEYNDNNVGLYSMGKIAHNLVWSKEEYCIFLEDDIVPSVSFFRFCAELLEKYKNDERIEGIVGENYLGISKSVTSDYFFARRYRGWSFATWRRVLGVSRELSDYYNDEYTMMLLENKIKKKDNWMWKSLNSFARRGYYENHPPWTEFYFRFDLYAQNRVIIIPQKNMITCLGANESSAHSDHLYLLPKRYRKIFDVKAYEIDFPLSHPKFVLEDRNYEREIDKIFASNASLFKRFFEKVERTYLLLRYKGILYTVKRAFRPRPFER